jgi:AbrB family looped-hinge helix DNA binding protein
MQSMKRHIGHHHFFGKPVFWGITSIGERGQVVIPIKARRNLGLKKGDKLLVVSRGNKFLGMIRFDELSGFLRKWLAKIEKIEGSDDQKSN